MKQMIRFTRGGLLLISMALVLAACSTSIKRVDSESVSDLSGMWNDTDSRLVSDEMVKDALSRPWISRFEAKNKRPPAVIVGEVRNLSHEHINVNTFVNDIERALINSGMVDFVASRGEREDIREERRDQDIHASEETRKAMGQEMGADFMLKGSINTIIDANDRDQVRYYQIDMTMISLANNRKVWVGQKKIKKYIKRSNLRQ